MDVKKAIRFISKHIADFKERTEGADDKEGCKKLIKEGEGVIELLRQGEKDKEELKKVWQMWNEIATMYKLPCYGLENSKVLLIVKFLEQKYFPKEVNHDYPEGDE